MVLVTESYVMKSVFTSRTALIRTTQKNFHVSGLVRIRTVVAQKSDIFVPTPPLHCQPGREATSLRPSQMDEMDDTFFGKMCYICMSEADIHGTLLFSRLNGKSVNNAGLNGVGYENNMKVGI